MKKIRVGLYYTDETSLAVEVNVPPSYLLEDGTIDKKLLAARLAGNACVGIESEVLPAPNYGKELSELTKIVMGLVKLQSIANQKLDLALKGGVGADCVVM